MMRMEIQYDRHDEEWEKCIGDRKRGEIAATWMQSGTLDRWRHNRMLGSINPFITKTSTWLTVGDGRYGTDAHYIMSQNGTAHASDISDKLLKIGNQKGFIDSYSQQNAEELSFEDNSFDYVLIKEALHHFPRPWLALYQAFRVCRKGVILIEPNDDQTHLQQTISGCLIKLGGAIKRSTRRILGNASCRSHHYNFEPVGNFVYAINPKELEKFLLGMHYTKIAFKGINDAYEEGIEFIQMNTQSTKERKTISRVKSSIAEADARCKAGKSSYSLLTAALFKCEPTDELRVRLVEQEWELKDLPKNPYL